MNSGYHTSAELRAAAKPHESEILVCALYNEVFGLRNLVLLHSATGFDADARDVAQDVLL